MAITVHGLDWPTTRALQVALADVPETGNFTFGGAKHEATEQLRRFQSAGLTVPEFTVSLATAESWVRMGGIVFARRENHTHGSDILIGRPGERLTHRWRQRGWWCRYISGVAEEWRIHIFNGSSIARGRKIWAGGGAFPAIPIRSRRNGWNIEHGIRPPETVREAARTAVAALGYPYGAVDLLELADGQVIVLEVNRMPAMDNYTREKYVQAIRQHVGGSVPHGYETPSIVPRPLRSGRGWNARHPEGYVVY